MVLGDILLHQGSKSFEIEGVEGCCGGVLVIKRGRVPWLSLMVWHYVVLRRSGFVGCNDIEGFGQNWWRCSLEESERRVTATAMFVLL